VNHIAEELEALIDLFALPVSLRMISCSIFQLGAQSFEEQVLEIACEEAITITSDGSWHPV
jgi:hypothetical protein